MNLETFILNIEFRDSSDSCVVITHELTIKNGGVSFVTYDGMKECFNTFEINSLEIKPLLQIDSRVRIPDE